MAAGLPIAAPAVGDIAAMVAEANLGQIVAPGSESALAVALEDLALEPQLRASIGEANCQKALSRFDQKQMIERYQRLYSSAMGRKSLS
jgi:glycosyltransferase involved in cell wall biosynthesis